MVKEISCLQVQWFYYEADETIVIPEKYSDSMSAKIEIAYKKDPAGSVKVGEEMKFKIDFKTMTETSLTPDNNQKMKVYRKLCEGNDYQNKYDTIAWGPLFRLYIIGKIYIGRVLDNSEKEKFLECWFLALLHLKRVSNFHGCKDITVCV